MADNRTLIACVAGLLTLTTACSSHAAPAEAPDASGASAGPGPSRVLFLGDSIAAGEAPPLSAAFTASGTDFRSVAADGGGNVVGPFSSKNWKKLPGQLASAEPDLVIYQITSYDWGDRRRQRAAYDRLLNSVTNAGAKLVFVTMPPIRPDDFYKPHMADLRRAPRVARAVAKSAPHRAFLLDARAVWGDTYRRVRNGTADRSTDGIHTCPQGAARFTRWLLAELANRFPGFTPAPPRTWANTGWSADKHFKGC